MKYEEVKEKLRGARSPTEKALHFAALLAAAGEVSPDDLIVVGGSAIEIYTNGQYTSGDIDIVLSPSRTLTPILAEWNFKSQGRIWYNDDLGIVLDFVKPPYTYDESRTQVLVTPHGPVRIAAIEDLLIKRLVSAKWWRRPGDVEHAKLLAVIYADRIDWKYVENLAKREDVGDVLTELRRALRTLQSK